MVLKSLLSKVIEKYRAKYSFKMPLTQEAIKVKIELSEKLYLLRLKELNVIGAH